ncbi:TIGR00341 family protein [Rhodococcus sp. Q]|uniref:TIGR00341 family protein n=1 Tax=Rhodococcus sp. Q TaxID=2502252 RepID=UPI0010F6D7F9|nr:TIGR00341 family protein [Rhodococcus sp. Q]
MLLIPDNQRRTLDELDDRLDLESGDRRAKRSAFWAMLALSAVIAVAGVAGDSTATVIGAMIVAPLSTPILGIGLGITTGRARLVTTSMLYVAAGVVLVVVIGAVVAQLLPNPTNVLANSQVTGRTSPTLMDLLAAIATGFAGAIAITRHDVGDVLPGVAIAISLVPPLGVVGVCLGSGAPSLAVGAFVLFASNVVAMVFTAIVVLFGAGYGHESDTGRARAYLALGVAACAVVVPMVVNSLSSVWARQVFEATQDWLSGTPDAEVVAVQWQSDTATVTILGPTELPPIEDLQRTVNSLVPGDPTLQIVHTVGGRYDAGR